MLNVSGLSKHFDDLYVLKDFDLCVPRKNFTVLIGPSGCGKSTLFDVLTGVIASLLAQGLSLAQAARAGVWLHGAAADRAVVNGERGLLASDLFAHLRRLVNDL